MQREEKRKAMMSELGGNVKVPDSRPKDVKEHLMMRLDELCENYENLKAKVVSTDKTEQVRGGQQEVHLPM